MPTSRRPLLLTALVASAANAALVATDLSASRLVAAIAAVVSFAWALWRRKGDAEAREGRLERLGVCLLACGAAWWALLVLALDQWVLFARGALWLGAGAATHLALVYAALGPRAPRASGGSKERHAHLPESPPALYGLVFLSLTLGTLALVETIARVVSPLRTYELVPDDPAAGPCLVRHFDGRMVGRPGCSGRYVHREFPGVRVEINALGLRDGLDEGRPLGPAETSVVVLGDSFAFGLGVPLEATFQERLERSLSEESANPTRVFGAAMPGSGVVDARLTLAELAPAAQPNLVVLALFEGNDLQDTWSRRRTARVGVSPEPVSARATKMAFLRALLGWGFWRTSSSVLQLRRVDGTPTRTMEAAFRIARPARIEEMTDALLEELDSLAGLCRRLDADLVVLLVPMILQAEPDGFHEFTARRPGARHDRLAFHRELARRLAARGLSVVDPLPALESETMAGRPCYFREGHWNAHGHRVASDLLHDSVRARRSPSSPPGTDSRHSAVGILRDTHITEIATEIEREP